MSNTPIRIARGNLRRVSLGDLPDNDSVFGKLHQLDFAIRFELSPELTDEPTAVRYMDLIIWMKDNVVFDTDQVFDLGAKWLSEISKEADFNHWVDITTPLTITEYQEGMVSRKPPSFSKSVTQYQHSDGGFIIDPIEDRKVDAIRLYTANEHSHRQSIVVSVNKSRTMFSPVGMEAWIDLDKDLGKLKPIPRETLRQGELSIAKVKEPASKIGPHGWRIIVCGNLSGCSAMLILSDEIDFKDWDIRHGINRKLNFIWSEVYENATLDKLEFEHLQKATGFKLRRPYYQVTLERLSTLMDRAKDLELMDWKYPMIKFSPVRHMDKANPEYPKMQLSELDAQQRQELELNLVNYVPTIDWPEEGEDTLVPTPFGDVTLSYTEWTSILNGFDVG